MGRESSRRELVTKAGALLAVVGLSGLPGVLEARDYASARQALDDLDQLAFACRVRLDGVRQSRAGVDLLAERFEKALSRHRGTRNDVRRRLGLPAGEDSTRPSGSGDADLAGLRQALDDLMIAYAESLPIFADASVVSRLAVDMVEVSKLRTVIDLWLEAETS